MNHKFVSADQPKNKVMDANVYDAERYDIFDPRNPVNKRKLEASKEAMKKRRWWLRLVANRFSPTSESLKLKVRLFLPLGASNGIRLPEVFFIVKMVLVVRGMEISVVL